MRPDDSFQQPVDMAAPLTEFSQCHAGIVKQLNAMAGLPGLVEAAARAREVAAGTLALFKGAVTEHHAEEESDLFPAVLRSAVAGEERDRVLLPLAETILRRNGDHMAALGLALHLRHVPQPVGYI